MIFVDSGITVTADDAITTKMDVRPIGANAFNMWRRKQHQTTHAGIQVFAASMKDIDKALRPKIHSDPHIKLPKHYHKFIRVFDRKEADHYHRTAGRTIITSNWWCLRNLDSRLSRRTDRYIP
jgi:hypothetical protein